MNIESIVQVSSHLSSQRNAASMQVEVVKLANDQIDAQGEAVLQLIEALPLTSGNVGNNIDITV